MRSLGEEAGQSHSGEPPENDGQGKERKGGDTKRW